MLCSILRAGNTMKGLFEELKTKQQSCSILVYSGIIFLNFLLYNLYKYTPPKNEPTY